MDSVEDAAQMAAYAKASFPVLADSQGKVAREYLVYDLLGDGVAAPSVFVVGKDRLIRWEHIGQDISDRPEVVELLRLIRDMDN